MATDIPLQPTSHPQLANAFEKAAKQTSEISKLPESIKRTKPAVAYEMPGPLGNAMRKQNSEVQFTKDYALSNTTRAKNYTDKSKSSPVLSKEDVREGTKGLLEQQFNNKSKGLDR